jgi:ankyrin repeat protein
MSVRNPVFSILPQYDDLRDVLISGSEERLKELLEDESSSSMVNFHDYRNGSQTLLHLASIPERRDAGAVRILLEHGADPKLVDDEGRVPLHLVVSEGTHKQTPSRQTQTDIHRYIHAQYTN